MTDNQYIRELEVRPPGGAHSARRVARIAEFMNAKSYLEVGVFRGTTFNCLNFERKVAVDPKFGFETHAFKEDGVTFCETTSDDYFISNGSKELFDIIFLDGLHTFKQTFKDFCNSLICSHDRTVWIVDDVVPLDIYGSLPDAGVGRALRKKETGNPSPSWNGDVYKILFAIHDFFPALNYIVINDRGNPQAIVWKVPRPDYKPLLDSLEAIDRLSYVDFLKFRPKLNQGTEAEALEILFQSLSGQIAGEVSPAEPAKADA